MLKYLQIYSSYVHFNVVVCGCLTLSVSTRQDRITKLRLWRRRRLCIS